MSGWVAAVITAKGSTATRATSIIKESRWSVKPTTAKSFRLVQADEIRRERVRNKQRKQGAEVAGRRSGKTNPKCGRAGPGRHGWSTGTGTDRKNVPIRRARLAHVTDHFQFPVIGGKARYLRTSTDNGPHACNISTRRSRYTSIMPRHTTCQLARATLPLSPIALALLSNY